MIRPIDSGNERMKKAGNPKSKYPILILIQMKRRDFIIKGGLATTATIAGTSILSSMNNNIESDTVNIGVIGTGSRGNGLISIINKIDGLRVAACCDVIPFRLKQGIKRVGSKSKAYSDYRKLLDNKDIDAVLISSTFNTHSQIAIDALDARKHVYCEKTMGKGIEGIKIMREKVEMSSKIFQTGHQYHSSKLYMHVVELIKSGKIGQVLSFECQWNRQGDWRRKVPDPKLERAINWRMYREYSGGLVAELCSHQIDFVNWVLGSTPKKVMGVGGIDYWKDGRETYDNIHLIYDYDNGVRAKFTCLTANAKDDYQIRVMGSKGTIILGYAKAWFYPEGEYTKKTMGDVDGVSGATATWEKTKGYPIKVEHADPSAQALIDFKDYVINNTTPISNVKTGSHAAFAVQMGLDAMYNGTIEYWKEDYN